MHRAILDKARQIGGRPSVYFVFVTTLHRNASMLLMRRHHVETVLHSREFMQGDVDPAPGVVAGSVRNVTDFRRAAFTRSPTLDSMRPQVSGALLGPFGLYPNDIRGHGILNSTAAHAFDPTLLPDAPFCGFKVWPPEHHVIVEWTDEASSV